MTPAIWLFLGTLATALITAGVGLATLHAARASAERQERVDQSKTTIDKTHNDFEILRGVIAELVSDLERVRARNVELESELRRRRDV